MKTLALVVFIVACGKKADSDRRWPTITNEDLACGSDADCTTRGRSCCSGCDDMASVAMNTKRAAKDDAARATICRDGRCPDISCDKPDCWDSNEPYCDRGRCAVRLVKRGSCTGTEQLAQICQKGTCAGTMATIVVWRDASGSPAVLQFHGGLDRCSHPSMVYYDRAGRELGSIPEQPAVPRSPEAKGFEATHQKLTAGLKPDPEVSCASILKQ